MPSLLKCSALMAIAIATAAVIDASPRAKTPSRIHQQPVTPHHEGEEETETQQAELNQVIGSIHWSDPAKGLAVMQLQRPVPSFDSRLITRDFELNPTAVIQPTAIRRNRMLGVIIVSGTVSAGDEVIIPGNAYRKAFGDLLKSE